MPSTWAQKIVKVLNIKLCRRFDSSSVWIPAMREVQRLVSEVGQIQQAVQKTQRKGSFLVYTSSVFSLLTWLSANQSSNVNWFTLLTCLPQVPWSNSSFAIALTYINWETDAIVGVELLQNVGIAIVCIFVTTLITLGNIFMTVSTGCTGLNLVGKACIFRLLYHFQIFPILLVSFQPNFCLF